MAKKSTQVSIDRICKTCWQNPEAEADVIRQYEARPHIGIFFDKDFRHFTTKQ